MRVEVTYLRVEFRVNADGTVSSGAGGSGSRRFFLEEIPDWLAANPGVLIASIKPI